MGNRFKNSTGDKRVWLFNAPLDLLIGCGGWSLPLIVLVSFVSNANAGLVASTFYFLTVFCNNPHYMATLYRAYGTGTDFNQYRFFTIYVTVLLVLTVILVHLLPALFPWVVTAYLVWSPWHYTGQNFGIAMLLARRGGAQPSHQDRQLLFASYAASYLVWLIALQSLEVPDPGLIVFRLPQSLTNALLPAASVVFAVLASIALFRITRTCRARAMVSPVLLSCAQGLWFIVPTLLQHYGKIKLPAAYYSAGVLAFMHCAQYLWITTYYARREAEQNDAARAKQFHFRRYYGTLIIGGLALFIPGPWLSSRLLGHEFVESFMIFAALVNLHHFILDGAIWKLRDNRIARILMGKNSGATNEVPSEGLPQLLRWLCGPTTAARVLRYSFVAGVVVVGLLDQAQFNLSRREVGLARLAHAQILNPQDTRVYFHRAQLLLAEGHTNAAEGELQRAIELNPRNVPAQQLLGELLFKTGNPAALAHYDRMAELFRPDLATVMNRGLLARQRGSNAVAIRCFEEALRLAPNRQQIHYLLADALGAVGATNAAMEQFEIYSQFHEGGAGSPEELPLFLAALLRLGELDVAQKDWARAAERWRRGADVAAAFQRFGESAMLMEKLAEAQDHLGKTAEAIATRHKATTIVALARTSQ